MANIDLRQDLKAHAALDRTQPIADPEFLEPSSGHSNQPWVVRSQNVLLSYSRAAAGDVVVDADFEFEWAAILANDSSRIQVDWEGEKLAASGRGVLVVPPGSARVVSTGVGDVVALIRTDDGDWAGRADNVAAYRELHPRVAPAVEWPQPVGGSRLRYYAVADYPYVPGRFGCIFRTRSFMVNFLPVQEGPRDTDKLSPHYHDDFEQCSLVTAGEFIHHVRTPWITDGTQWKPDHHVTLGSPSVAIIPPPTVHTSASTAEGANHLIDIFSPPRVDFSLKSGWVVNANDYPMP